MFHEQIDSLRNRNLFVNFNSNILCIGKYILSISITELHYDIHYYG